MGYIEKNLVAGENLLYETKLHWIAFKWPVIWLIVAIISYSASTEYSSMGMLAIMLMLISIPLAVINFKTSEFGLTDKRVLMKTGFIRRNSSEILLTKIEGLQVKQGVLGRILNYGTILISGTGEMKNPFSKIEKPLDFRKRVQEQLALNESAGN